MCKYTVLEKSVFLNDYEQQRILAVRGWGCAVFLYRQRSGKSFSVRSHWKRGWKELGRGTSINKGPPVGASAEGQGEALEPAIGSRKTVRRWSQDGGWWRRGRSHKAKRTK